MASPYDLAQQFSHRNPRKACGEDRLGDDFVRACAQPLSRQMHPVSFKTISQCQAPIQDKGGQITAIPKGSASAMGVGYRPNNTRDI